MILAKACHDLDIIQWLLNEECARVQSFGSLRYFCRENMPKGAPEYCYQGCPHGETCFYNAVKIYVDPATGWYKNHCSPYANPNKEQREEAIKTSQFGKCVYKCDNDVVDHQIVSFTFGKDIQATLTMSAFNKGGRTTTFMGTKGERRANMEKNTLEFYSFDTLETTDIYNPEEAVDQTIAGGHGGGDLGIMADLYEYVANNNPSNSISDI
jgi:predicted dehydrogenase